MTKLKKRKLCECNCGTVINPEKRFFHGHNTRGKRQGRTKIDKVTEAYKNVCYIVDPGQYIFLDQEGNRENDFEISGYSNVLRPDELCFQRRLYDDLSEEAKQAISVALGYSSNGNGDKRSVKNIYQDLRTLGYGHLETSGAIREVKVFLATS